MTRHENEYKPMLVKRLASLFPGSFFLKNDEQLIPGIPDLLMLWGNRWAALEVKRDEREMRKPRPNQPYYVELLNGMSFAAFICPENEEEVLDALQRSFEME